MDHVKEIELTGMAGGAPASCQGGLLFKFRPGDVIVLRPFVLVPFSFRKVST